MLRDARRVSFGRLIDYAGVFPPAALDIDSAVAAYRAVRTGSDAWIVGRFLCPTSRLTDLAAVLTATLPAGEPPWQIGVVFDEPAGVAASHAATFHQYSNPAAVVVSAEARLTSPSPGGAHRTALAASSIAAGVAVYLEVANTPDGGSELPTALEAIAAARAELRTPLGAKLRCRGSDGTTVPSVDSVATFLIACRDRALPFTATAGLHHPVRHRDRTHHGFVNLLAAAAAAAGGASHAEVAAIVAEDDPNAFSVGLGSLGHRGRSLSTRTLEAVRAGAFTAFGSCDLVEPIADLHLMGLL